MKCPGCGSNLHEIKRGKVAVDICIRCGGTWFDGGELAAYLSLVDYDKVKDAPPTIGQPVPVSLRPEARRPCPRCDVPMRKMNYAFDSGIILDKCPDCAGVWADKGELRRIASFRKGNARLDALGKSILENQRKVRRVQDTSKYSGLWLGLLFFFPGVPLYDDNPRERFPLVTWALIGACVAVYLLQVNGGRSFTLSLALVPSKVFGGRELWTFVTCMFAHGGLMHLLGNMLFLYIFGDNVEDVFGRGRFLLFYLAAGLGATAAHIALDPRSSIPTLGASGAISGVLGAYFLYYPFEKVVMLIMFHLVEIPAVFFLGFWFVMNVLGAFSVSQGAGGVAFWAHLGGFLTGFVMAFVFKTMSARKQALMPTEGV